MYLRVLSNKIAIAPIERTNITLKGIIIPNLNSPKLCEGIVISSNSELKTGDKILYIKTERLCYNFNSLEVDIIDMSDVVALFQSSYNKWD
ncbi:10 kDa chaperonin [Candidatus Hodgkinia cicadicola]|uniref:10 kDa chaperonin n=1 Tax=Candidatus Hodgkinia cicadicola TaxID=573658 RepID=A0ABX4MGD5_9HYPH|nr:10 kDa chaperonin [Candidatus Hodgkinia cicadicola]